MRVERFAFLFFALALTMSSDSGAVEVTIVQPASPAEEKTPAGEISPDPSNEVESLKKKKFVQLNLEPHTSKQHSLNFGLVYLAEWGFYLVSQQETIREHGNIEKWLENIGRTGFDRDNFEYNIYKHTWAGSYYYMFYRSRGYDTKNAFVWTFISSLAFEYTVETLTEPPSLQDVYQTPIYGTLAGMGLEKLSLYLHSTQFWPARALGFVLNPFTLFSFSAYEWVAAPSFNRDYYGMRVGVEF